MSRRRQSTGELIVGLIAPVLGLMFLLGLVGVLSVYRTNEAVNEVTREISPGIAANEDYLQLMTDAESAVRGWAIDGNTASLLRYETALGALPTTDNKLHSFADNDEALAGLVEQQSELAQAWIDEYAEPRLGSSHGLAGYDATRFTVGQSTFSELRAVNAEIDETLELRSEEAIEAAQNAFRRVLIAVILLTAAATLVGWFVGRRLRSRVEKPLAELERTVQALAAGDTTARARIGGPREIAVVAEALNRLAAENERANALEAQTRAQLLELDQAKSDFVSNVSHELRTPLTSIKGYLELLRDDIDPQGDAARPWNVIERNVDRLGLLVEDLLTLANVESRNTTLTEVDLRGIIEDVAADLRIAAANRDIAMSIELPATPVRILADKVQLLRATLNVVSNAVKFCRDGGRVDVRLAASESEAIVTVRDTGIGIPADQLASLGGRFFRASNAIEREIGGTGLGVRMVQSIITKHGGTVAFESEENEYTLVTITLPVRGRHGD